MTLNLEDVIASIKSGDFQVDCISMRLRRNKPDTHIEYVGAGYIALNGDGDFHFKIYSSEVIGTDKFKNFSERANGKAGQLFKQDEYYTLTAEDIGGNVWVANSILPGTNWGLNDNPVVYGQLYFVDASHPVERDDNFIRLCFFDDVSLPYTRMSEITDGDNKSSVLDRHEFTADDTEYTIRKVDYGFYIDAYSKSSFKENIQLHLQQAIRYILGKSVSWRVMSLTENKKRTLRLISKPRTSLSAKLTAPIPGFGYPKPVWQMFIKYLQYVTAVSHGTYIDHCSYHLQNAREASAGSIDSTAVGLTVAVEGLASLIEAPKSSTIKDIEALKGFVVTALEGHSEYRRLTERFKGMIGSMNSIGPKDRLKPLVDSGHLDGKLLKTWNELRNSQVHPKKRDLRQITPEYTQNLFNSIHDVTTLLYQLTFYLIGYEGQYADCSVHGHPISTYPLKGVAETHPSRA